MSNESFMTDGDRIADFVELTKARDQDAYFCRINGKEMSVSDMIREMRDPHSPSGAIYLHALKGENLVDPYARTSPSNE